MGRVASSPLAAASTDPVPGRLALGFGAAEACICLLLLALIAAVYAQVASFEFLNYDDDLYVAANPAVSQGLTLDGVRRAFTAVHSATWHPLATISHMADCSLFGLRAGGHHLVNVVFHVLSTLLLFVTLRAMTGARWRSAFVAAMFGLHPLHVESVAWISERKDVLSTFFGMLTVASYVYYVQSPVWRRYALVLLAYVLALLSKPMVVTLPVILLLLDVWPLGRLTSGGSLAGLVREKIPLFILSAALCVVTIGAQAATGAMVPLASLPVRIRLANAPVAYVRYIGKMFWPVDLAILYPYQFLWPAWEVAGASLLLLAVTVLFHRLGPRHRYALVGWLWYVIALLPVIGILQAGVQAIADRFTYVPLIGLWIVAAWGAYALVERWRFGPRLLAVVGVIIVAACLPVTWAQVRCWRNSYSVFEHALAVTRDNAVAHEYLGKALLADGRLAEAATHFEEQVRLLPFLPDARLQLGVLLARLGQRDAAAAQTAAALPLLPPDAEGAYYNLGNVQVRQGRFEPGVTSYRMALALAPEWPEAHHNLGIALASLGKSEEALVEFAEALRLRPDFAEAHVSRGLVFAEQGRSEEAIAAYLQAVQLRPSFAAAQRRAGIVLAQQGRIAEAVAHLQEAIRLVPEDAEARQELAQNQVGPSH